MSKVPLYSGSRHGEERGSSWARQPMYSRAVKTYQSRAALSRAGPRARTTGADSPDPQAVGIRAPRAPKEARL